MSKYALIVLLVGANLLLLACLLLSAYTPPKAIAQEVAAQQPPYALISAQTVAGTDVLYMLDVQNRLLHAFRIMSPRVTGGRTQIGYVFTRNLARDFPRFRQREAADE